jgi:hypothetical protein
MSAKHYVRITEDEFEEFLFGLVPDAERADVPGTRETVYDLPLPGDGLTIRVFSTIQGGEGRDRGDDAIRCVVWNHEIDAPVGGRRKTLRIGTWRKNLRAKIEDLYANWRDHVYGTCPECGRGVLVERESGPGDEWDPFLACSEWDGGDGCEHTEALR